MRYGLVFLVVIVYLLHQDFWFWNTPFPLIFGFLPIGLAYHGAYSLLVCLLMIVLVRSAWPSHLEEPHLAAGDQEDEAH
jgi:hypothetical protein